MAEGEPSVSKHQTVGEVVGVIDDQKLGRLCLAHFPSAAKEMLVAVSEQTLRGVGIEPTPGTFFTAAVNHDAQTPKELLPEGFAPAEVPTDEELGL